MKNETFGMLTSSLEIFKSNTLPTLAYFAEAKVLYFKSSIFSSPIKSEIARRLSSVSAAVCTHIARGEYAMADEQIDEFPFKKFNHDEYPFFCRCFRLTGNGFLREDTVS